MCVWGGGGGVVHSRLSLNEEKQVGGDAQEGIPGVKHFFGVLL